jgi:hypothetical protein
MFGKARKIASTEPVLYLGSHDIDFAI